MSLTRNILSTLSARVFMLGLALVSSVVLARVLGPEGRGIFALVLLMTDLASSFAQFGFDQANAVFAGLEPDKRRELVWQSVILALVVGGVLVAIGSGYLLLGAPGFQSLIRGPVWLYLLALSTLPARLLSEYLGAVLRGMNRIALINVLEVGTKASSLGLVVALVAFLRFGVAGAVWADFLAQLGTVILMIVLLRGVAEWRRGPAVDWGLWKRTGRFAFPAYCSTVLSYLNYRVDQVILAFLMAPNQLAYYVIAVGLAERLWLPTGAAATALLPHLTNLPKRDSALPGVVTRHVLIWTGAACVGIWLLADVIVRLLYSSAYAPAAAALRWLLPGIFTLSAGKVLIAEILARKKVSITVWVASIAAVANVAGNFLLIPRMGISGAALASSISYTLLAMIVTWYYLRITGVSWMVLLPTSGDLRGYLVLLRRQFGGVTQSKATP